MILAGDIGGTKIHLAFYRSGRGGPEKAAEKLVGTSDVASIPEALRDFAQEEGEKPEACGLGIAGPVLDGAVRGVNLPWAIVGSEVSAALDSVPVRLLNDLEAGGHGLDALGESDLETIQDGQAVPGANRVLVSPGTGLGESIVVRVAGRTHPVGSEGGHADFAPRTDEEIELLRYLRPIHGRVSVERVVSGPGIVGVFRWMRSTGRVPDDSGLPAEPDDSAPAAISRAALDGSSALCRETMRVWISLLGAETGNATLRGFGVGGVFLGGGIPAQILPALKTGEFLEAFRDKAPWAELLAEIPVRVIVSPDTTLLGAAVVALEEATAR